MATNKIEILKDVLNALLDKSRTVKIETLWPESGSKIPRIPNKVYKFPNGISANHMKADSVTLGSGITIRRIWNEPIKDPKGHEISTGWHWIVRTPRGEASFPQNDNDLGMLWGAALNKADELWGKRTEEEITKVLLNYVQAPELRKIIEQGPTKTESSAKYQQATKGLKSISAKNMTKILANKKQND